MTAPDDLADRVHRRARSAAADAVAYTFLADGAADARSITWAELDRRAAALAGRLVDRGATGEAVLLALPSGLAFVESLFACWYAGATAVPVSLPRQSRTADRLSRIVADAGARLAIGTADVRDRVAADGVAWVDPAEAGAAGGSLGPRGPVAVLQYTSGSTGHPRGVAVTHANLTHNSGLIAAACGHGPGDTIGGWLPLFHDMGLVGLVLQAAFVGCRCVLMPPERFLMRPWLWLRMVADHGLCSSPAPNFAYDLCVDRVTPPHAAGLDLSRWRNALNGSEPVRPATLERFAAAFAGNGFRPAAFLPCYGLAEATLFVTGPGPDRDGPTVVDGRVGCGRPGGGTRLVIVDPHTCGAVAAGTVGEVWVAGDSCADGYRNDAAATAATFDGRLAGDGVDARWLRTGDLGFIDGTGELFVTGRLRDLVIVAGRNHHPVDLEQTVEAADPAVAPGGSAAFAVDVDGLERLVVVAELRRDLRGQGGDATGPDLAAIGRRLRAAVAAAHEVAPHAVELLRPGGLPRTTSGKVRRSACREAYLSRTLPLFAEDPHVGRPRP